MLDPRFEIAIAHDLLEGVGEALDPGSAMEKQVRVVEKKLGHKIYDPSNDKVEYRKLGLK